MVKLYRVKLRRPKAFGGVDHPAGAELDVPLGWARRWVGAGAAEAVSTEPLPDVPPLSVADLVQHAEPAPTRRRRG